jgi:hypothetical protein
LDWTYDPLVAIYFASESQSDSSHIAVWAFNNHLYKDAPRPVTTSGHGSVQIPPKFGFGPGLVAVVPEKNPFLAAQRGTLTHIATDFDPIRQSWVPAEECAARNSSHGSFLKKFILPRSEVPRLRLLLWREGVNRVKIMPTLDNLAIMTRRSW